jgi:hypothetical protein
VGGEKFNGEEVVYRVEWVVARVVVRAVVLVVAWVILISPYLIVIVECCVLGLFYGCRMLFERCDSYNLKDNSSGW